MSDLPEHVHEALRRSGVVWVRTDRGTGRPAWHLWHDGALLLVTGPGEQDLPGLAGARTADVVVRAPGPLSGAVAELACEVERIAPGTPDWETAAPLLAAARLNAPDQAGLVARWADDGAAVVRLRPLPR